MKGLKNELYFMVKLISGGSSHPLAVRVPEVLHRPGHQDQGGVESQAPGVCPGDQEHHQTIQGGGQGEGEGGLTQEPHLSIGGEIHLN